ncbi:MAG: hypothetical protein KAH84_12895 [Thiomargarita sp.]|nr:hypothetical protein [Thiomargarita sp.]
MNEDIVNIIKIATNNIYSPDLSENIMREIVEIVTKTEENVVISEAKQHYLDSLAAIILGNGSKLVKQTIENWLQQQAPIADKMSVFDILTVLKHRLNRAISIYNPSNLASLHQEVQDWTKTLLAETEITNFETLWQLLERSQIVLKSLQLELPFMWEQTLGQAT